MSLQAIRYKIEGPVSQAFTAQSVTFYGENQTPTNLDADGAWARASVSFGSMTTSGLNKNFERIRGSIVIELFVPKNQGPAEAQTKITPVMLALNTINDANVDGSAATGATVWVRDVRGPDFIEMDEGPFFMARVNAGFTASYT